MVAGYANHEMVPSFDLGLAVYVDEDSSRIFIQIGRISMSNRLNKSENKNNQNTNHEIEYLK